MFVSCARCDGSDVNCTACKTTTAPTSTDLSLQSRTAVRALAEIAQSVAHDGNALTPRPTFAKALRRLGHWTTFFCFDNMLADFIAMPVDELPEDIVAICDALDDVESHPYMYTVDAQQIASALLLQLSQALLEAADLNTPGKRIR